MTGNWKLPFGKHKGTEIEEVYEDDRAYLEWCAENLENDDLREKIGEFLEELDERYRKWGRR